MIKMNFYFIIFFTVLAFSLCAIIFAVMHEIRKRKVVVNSNKSREIVDLLRIHNDYEKILTVFNDLDSRCREYGIEIAPDFSGYFE